MKNAIYAFKEVDKGKWSEQHIELRLESTRVNEDYIQLIW